MSRENSRYTYTLGSRPEGVIVYDSDLKLHSHHDSDPARGQHSAFDLVRLHRFGHLDSDSGELPMAERPSYKAMCEFASDLPEIRQARAVGEFEDLGELPAIPHGAFEFLPASEFTRGAPMRWIIKGVLSQTELAIIYGASGSGKTFLALDIVKAITAGSSWCERPTLLKGRVAYICAEGAQGMKARIRAAGLSDDLRVLRAAPNLMDRADTAAIAASMLRTGPYVACVVDNLSRVHGGNENSAADMGLVLKHCQFLHEKTGALVILIHHSGKDESLGARGSTALKAAADVEIEVSGKGTRRAWRTAKVKDGPDDLSGAFFLRPVTLDIDGEEVTTCVVEHHGRLITTQVPTGKNQIAAYQAIEAGAGKLSSAIIAALKLRGVRADKVTREQRRTMKEAFLDLQAKKLIVLDVDADACDLSAAAEDWLNGSQ